MSPALHPDDAALVAQYSLADTFAVASACNADRRIAVFDGEPDQWVPKDWDVVAQRGGNLATRLADAFDDVFALVEKPSSVVLIAMDTPQVTLELLHDAFEMLDRGSDSVLGMTEDGGYWTIGLRRPQRAVFDDVAMSTDQTGADQLARLEQLGLTVKQVEALRDLDTVEDVAFVAEMYPHLQVSKWWNLHVNS